MPNNASNVHVAIIGAGLSGLGMALALHTQAIKCTIYERSPSTGRFAGAIMLSPNSLRILDRYGLYGRIREHGYSFEVVEVKDSEGVLRDNGFYLGSRELFGYDALRIYRNNILTHLTHACVENGIEIFYDKRLAEIASEDCHGVEFTFEDGSRARADILIAADGIYSKIRTSLFPHVQPQYNGVLVVCGTVKASSLQAESTTSQEKHSESSSDTQINSASMIGGRNGVGAFLLGPQLPDASELLAGTQRPYPAQTREEWARLSTNREFHLSFLREGYEDRSPIVQRAVDNIVDGSTYIWPLHTLPKLDRWWSEATGRVILIGDAAHAMPPTSGQGANQAFEDGWTLARALARLFGPGQLVDDVAAVKRQDSELLKAALKAWHAQRQARIDQILTLTRKMHNLRLPLEEQRKLGDGEVWKSLSRLPNMPKSEEEGDSAADNEAFRKSVVDQWGWLYCPEDLVADLKANMREVHM